jgi:hypothetical protein
MANHHFAKLADIWKHLPLAEILALEHPGLYWESHGGSADYKIIDDAERRFGVLGLWEIATSKRLAGSRYLRLLRRLNDGGPLRTYPGSPLIAMAELGSSATYTFCDLDPTSVASLRARAGRLDLLEAVTVVPADGLATLHEALRSVDAAELLVHIDPFDPWAAGSAGLSALDLAAEIAECGGRLVYWYGYDRPQRRGWARDEIQGRTRAHLWCGDVMVIAAHEPTVSDDGDLGQATTPGTGIGIVCANLDEATLLASRELGEALAVQYRDRPLPNGVPGGLDFLVI